MTPTEAVQLVAIVRQLSPSQRIEEYTADVWHGALADIPLDEAVEAAQRVVRSSPWIDPAGIVRERRALLDDRRRRNPSAVLRLPSRFESDAERAERINRGVAMCRAAITPEDRSA